MYLASLSTADWAGRSLLFRDLGVAAGAAGAAAAGVASTFLAGLCLSLPLAGFFAALLASKRSAAIRMAAIG
jgi:hypothetical protein